MSNFHNDKKNDDNLGKRIPETRYDEYSERRNASYESWDYNYTMEQANQTVEKPHIVKKKDK